MSNDALLTVAAMVLEIGVPLALIVAYAGIPSSRRRVVVVLGAVTPPLLFYAWSVVAFVIDPRDPSNRFSFYAMWVMTAVVYAICVVAAALVAFLPRPANLPVRFGIGVGTTVAIVASILRFKW